MPWSWVICTSKKIEGMFRTVQANQADQWLTSAERKLCNECDYNIICVVCNRSYLCSII